jgi:hypothetical protein
LDQRASCGWFMVGSRAGSTGPNTPLQARPGVDLGVQDVP